MERDGVVRVSEGAIFIDPPTLLSSGYVEHQVVAAGYYARARPILEPVDAHIGASTVRKRKRKQRKEFNEKELSAMRRHNEARSFLVEAHRAFLSSEAAQARLKDAIACISSGNEEDPEENIQFVQLAQVFQAPLYEIMFQLGGEHLDDVGYLPLFNTLVESSSSKEQLASCVGSTFVLPRASEFLMSDFTQIKQLVDCRQGSYNLVLIDPPWENKSVHRRSIYPTLPNKNLLSLPVQQLVDPDGAIVALWITNREKLRSFTENELFPAWGLTPVAVWYWLKVTEGGRLVSDLDSTHHKPYECMLVARTTKSVSTEAVRFVPHNFVVISLPGEHSRKPPLGLLLSDFVPGPRPVKALELFAREMNPNWTSWGNEPLRFQNKLFFSEK